MNRIEDTSKEFEPLLSTQDIISNHYQYGISKHSDYQLDIPLLINIIKPKFRIVNIYNYNDIRFSFKQSVKKIKKGCTRFDLL